MILSDRSLREAIDAGRIVIEPYDATLVQPSSIDVRLDRLFRVFRNHTAGVIDVKQDQRDLTELVEIPEDGAFMLHPGEFVLGSTLERVAVPDDLVGRVEGKSSLARLGLLIHSSLPASEPLLVLDADGLALRTIGEIVKERRACSIVGFDPLTLDVAFHEVTGTYAGPPDRIYEVRLASGRTVHVTAGHNLFTPDRDGEIVRTRTADLAPGTQVAIARRIPPAPRPNEALDVIALVPESERATLTVDGPSVARAHAARSDDMGRLLHEHGYVAVGYYRSRARLPYPVAALVPGLLGDLGQGDRVSRRGESHALPARIGIDPDLAWLLGMYVAEGHRRGDQATISTTDQARLDRLETTLARLGLPVHRNVSAVTCCSGLVSDLLGWMGTGAHAPTKRVPPFVFGWSDELVRAFLDGLVDGDGSVDGVRTSASTTSEGLVADVLLLVARLGRRGADGDVGWDRVVAVTDTGRIEPIYDLEVRPGGRKIENFLAGSGGVFVSNTAGFIDAGFDGHITLELANVASLPITLYPGMKIGQISFMEMTTPAEHPYGKGATGSKYQGQRGPTPSRYFDNFSS